MSLQGRAIREAVVEILLARPVPHVGSRIYSGRTRGLWRQELPAILVHLPRATARVEAEGDGRLYLVEGELVIETVVQDLEAADDLGDEIESEVQEALFLDEVLGGCAMDCRYAGTEIGLDGDGEKQVALVVTRWTVTWGQEAPAHRHAPDLELVHETTSIGGDDSPVEEQTIAIPQPTP